MREGFPPGRSRPRKLSEHPSNGYMGGAPANPEPARGAEYRTPTMNVPDAPYNQAAVLGVNNGPELAGPLLNVPDSPGQLDAVIPTFLGPERRKKDK